jgi:dihydrofolate synthase/folylpolyglutamate synthase
MDFLNDSLLYGMKPGLQNMEIMCRYFNHPEKSFQVIHVVGTNGKGSSAYYLAQILKAHGKKSGSISSPHLVSLQERIRVNQKPFLKPI